MTTEFTTYDTPEQIAEDDREIPPGHPLHAAIGRTLSDVYTFWSLCDIARCRRAGRCSGNPERCLDTCLPLLSPKVVEGGLLAIDAKCNDMTVEEAIDRWPDELRHLWTWTMLVEKRHGAPRPRVEAACRDRASVPSPCSPSPAAAAPRRRRPRS